MATIELSKLLGGKVNAVSVSDAERLHRLLCQYLAGNQSVIISFEGIRLCSSAFLNVAIGRLYDEYEHSFISKHITCTKLSPGNKKMLLHVINNSKKYFSKLENTSEHCNDLADALTDQEEFDVLEEIEGE